MDIWPSSTAAGEGGGHDVPCPGLVGADPPAAGAGVLGEEGADDGVGPLLVSPGEGAGVVRGVPPSGPGASEASAAIRCSGSSRPRLRARRRIPSAARGLKKNLGWT